jgi:hypothetical protein
VKTDAFKPRNGVDRQIGFDPRVESVSETQLKSATKSSTVFHELAEAYAKVEHGKKYAQAHQEAIDREKRLRDQRPYLKAHNPGAGPGDKHEQLQPTKAIIRR